MEKMEKRKLGSLNEVLGKVWDLYVNKGASNTSTRRHLQKMECFTETQIFHLMEDLQYNKRRIVEEKRGNDEH